MKKLLCLGFAALPLAGVTQGQRSNVCDPPTAQTTIHANNIKARLLNGGDLFSNAQFFPNPTPNGPDPATIYAAGLWIGGIDPGGNLKLAASTYRSGTYLDYWAGPLDEDGTTDEAICTNWDKLFQVKGTDIKAFLDDLPDLANNPAAAISAYKDIMGWPAKGNPYFTDVWGFALPLTPQGLASFHDEDQDGYYNPLAGDYPVVKLYNKPEFLPAEIVWCVFNDEGGGAIHSASQGSPLQMEIQFTAWAFTSANKPVLNNTLFTSYKIINRAVERVDSCFLGLWVDFDIGCYVDDYVGCDSTLDAFYAYNQDMTDGQPGSICAQNIPTFADTSPVQSVTFLSHPMDKFVYYNNPSVNGPSPAMTDPDLPSEYYNYLTGRWKDGSPLSYGSSGYQSGGITTGYAFPSDPNESSGWSMCTANLPFFDRRVVGSTKIMTLEPGQIGELVAAWTVHPNPNLPCDLGSTFADIAFLHDEFENDFPNANSVLSSPAPSSVDALVDISPNPATERVTLQYGDLPVREIRLFAADGRLVRVLQNIQPEQIVLDVAGLGNGVYTVQLLTDRGSVARKILVLR